jgi:short-subunit dehydrogenase
MKVNKSILITGSSSGIGKACALHLDEMGYMVFAGVRNAEDGYDLKKQTSDRFRTIILDVTNGEMIENAVEVIKKETDYPLFALINNAGIALRGVLEVTHENELRKVLEVNVIGLHAMTRAFLPLLRKNKGRIINMGSENSFKAGENGSSYAASKFAVRAISDSLRLEMIPFDVSVSLIAPTSTHSDVWKKNEIYRKKLHQTISNELHEVYKFFIRADNRSTLEHIKPIKTSEVVESMLDALFSKEPKYVYHVKKKAKKVYGFSKLPKRIAIRYIINPSRRFIRWK